MKRVIAISLISHSFFVQANDLCNLREAAAEKKVKINGLPGWFFKVHPDGKFLSFIEGGQNQLLNLETGLTHKLSGEIDPVWSPDGAFMTHPARGSKGEKGIQIFIAKDIISKTLQGKTEESKSVESPLSGVYQSIGKLGSSYKMISDLDGVSLTNFERDSNGQIQTGAVVKPCPNYNFEYADLPMISKDGRFLSVYHSSEKRTKIYRLAKEGANCDVALDLGYSTGKVSFNRDSSQIAFHVEQFSEFQNGYFSGVGKDKVLNVVVLKLNESSDGKLVPTAWAMASHHTKPGDGGYYPDFDTNGNVYFMEDINNNFQFVKVNKLQLDFHPLQSDLVFGKKNCVNCEAEKNSSDSALHLLSKMWKNICGSHQMLTPELALAIDPAQCRIMVNKFYLKSMTASKDTLLNACPKPKNGTSRIVGKWDPNQAKTAEQLLKSRCLGCHSVPRVYEADEEIVVETSPHLSQMEEIKYKKTLPVLELEKLTMDQTYQMLNAIRSGKMPKGDPLPLDKQQLLITYLHKLSLDLDRSSEESPSLIVRRYSELHLVPLREKAYAANPGMTIEQKRQLDIVVNCTYGQRDCEEYINSEKASLSAAASKIPENEREEFIQSGLQKARCLNPIPDHYQECLELLQKKQ